MERYSLKWMQEFTMPSKKPPVGASTANKPANRPPLRQHAATKAPNARQQPDNRWQRSKRYGWDGR